MKQKPWEATIAVWCEPHRKSEWHWSIGAITDNIDLWATNRKSYKAQAGARRAVRRALKRLHMVERKKT